MSKQHPTQNDQRSVVKTPGSAAYDADRQNRQRRGHGNVPPPAVPGTPATDPRAPLPPSAPKR